jgi:Circularly permutated YpsA SLOG family
MFPGVVKEERPRNLAVRFTSGRRLSGLESYRGFILGSVVVWDFALFGISCLTPRRLSGRSRTQSVGGDRTRLNVVDSDGIAILYYESLSGGTRLTRNLCALLKRPYSLIDARQMYGAVAAVAGFVEKNGIQTLNVAGPRLSGWTAGCEFALAVVTGVVENGRMIGIPLLNCRNRRRNALFRSDD